MENQNYLKDIPAMFYSFHEEKPFQKCIECERNLLEDDCEYVIEKSIRNYAEYNTQDVILDFAICMDCAARINKQLSKESMLNIRQYFTDNVDLEKREQVIMDAEGDIKKLTSRCMIKDTDADQSGEFQFYAYCVGSKINLQNPPYMISGAVQDEVAELISDETRDILNGFFDKHFSPDPSLMQPVPGPRVVLF